MDPRLTEAFANLDDRMRSELQAEAEWIACKQRVADSKAELARAMASTVGVGNSVVRFGRHYIAITIQDRVVLREF